MFLKPVALMIGDKMSYHPFPRALASIVVATHGSDDGAEAGDSFSDITTTP
jgi:hypothetical protein